MAIKKSFLTTSGILIDEAYYKVSDIEHSSNNTYKAIVRIYTNEYQRHAHPEQPLAENRMMFEVDPSMFEVSPDENKIKQAYIKLKSLTDSFKNDSIDV